MEKIGIKMVLLSAVVVKETVPDITYICGYLHGYKDNYI